MALNFTFSAFADEADPNFDLQLAALKRNRIPLLEIRGVDGKGVLDLTDAELKTVCEKLAEAGIGVSAVGSPIGKIGIRDDFAPHFEKFKRAVEIAKKLGTARIRMFSFFIPQGEDPESCFDEVVRRVSALVAYAEENGVHCCHENEKGIYGDTLARVQKLHAAVPGLRCVFDPANYIQCGDDPAVNFKALAPMIDYMHVKDALFADGSVVPAGEGDGSVPQILAALAETGKPYILTIEPHLFDFSGLSALQDEELTHKRVYRSGEEAFDAAADALHAICEKINL